MIAYTPRARNQVTELLRHYHERRRPEAIRNLFAALLEASAVIETDPSASIPSPRSYSTLVQRGWRWVKAPRSWLAYREQPALAFVAVFHETANIPKRL